MRPLDAVSTRACSPPPAREDRIIFSLTTFPSLLPTPLSRNLALTLCSLGTPASGTATPVSGMPSLPSKEEVLAAVPPQGMSMGDFLKRFAIKGLPAEQRTEMTVMMRTLFRIDKGTKTLFRK